VQNALVHNLPSGGSATVRTLRLGGQGALVVENTGDRLDPAVVATLVEPFQRGAGRTRDGRTADPAWAWRSPVRSSTCWVGRSADRPARGRPARRGDLPAGVTRVGAARSLSSADPIGSGAMAAEIRRLAMPSCRAWAAVRTSKTSVSTSAS
jgi:hypothetical protein